RVLGNFVECARRLFTRVASLGEKRSLPEWSQTLTETLEAFFQPDEDREKEIQVLRRTLQGLAALCDPGLSGFSERVDIHAVASFLRHSLERQGFGRGYITGGVTFCAMLPMRSIPFRVICLVGMNGDAYPRQGAPPSFDLMALHPRPGDRSRRNDDRYLFLEALLSARERLHISYVGQDVRDNTPIPPSVLVSEFLDYIGEGFALPGGDIIGHVMTGHRLQAFSPAYFDKGERLFSYSREDLLAARALIEGPEDPVPFVSRGLSAPDEAFREVSVSDLSRFWANPARFLLQRRLGIRLEEEVSVLDDREPFVLQGLDRYQLEQELMKRGLEGRDPRDLFPAVRASGRLPQGTVGECVYDDLTLAIGRFVHRTAPYLQGTLRPPLEVDLPVAGFRLRGLLEPIIGDRYLHYRHARVKARDRLRFWLHHLILNAAAADSYPRKSMLAGLNPDTRKAPLWTAWQLPPLEGAEEILARFLDLYWRGLVRPLPFFPEVSWVYAEETLAGNRTPERAIERARAVWNGSEYSRGQREDPYWDLCFRAVDPLDEEFRELAEWVFGPFLERMERIV
ncbi:MAG: exodeoxyribonuclease V subunit gamma, partial [Deltaproteobacteria bacterium]|nr:exodeoxyribonuclease V subunit gamma [Deltaproteobacteria bacterium]